MNDTKELEKALDNIQAEAMPEFLEDGSVRIFVTIYPAGSLVAAAFRNYRTFILEGA